MKQYLTNSLWVLLEKVIRLSVVFLFFSLVSQKLSVYDFGIFSLSQTVVTLIIGIVAFGFDNVLIKDFSSSQRINEYFSTAMIFRLAISIFAISLFCLVMIFMSYGFIYKLVFMASSLSIIFQTQTIYYSYYQAVSKSIVITKTSIAALVISSIIKLAIIYYELGIVYYALSFSLDYLFSFLFIYFVSKKNGLLLKVSLFEFNVLKKLINQSYPVLVSTIIVMIYTRIDQFMIAKYLSIEDVAKFSVAVRISDAYMFIPMAIAASFFPMVSKDPSSSSIQKYFNITHLVTVVSALMVIVMLPLVIGTFFGVRYHESIQVANIIVIANVISALGFVSSNILIIRNISYLRIYRAIYGLIINIALNIILIPKFGIIGAAYSSLFSQIIAAWIANSFSPKTRDCFVFQFKTLVTFGLPSIKQIYKELRLDK
ncbi:flippase [Pantoea coffeiphila]|uniref:flippase n=1 Tax=Pantoea coffeiphila TaxID=1465635 RepID=UPI001960E669|nr:flippase [Pantoea coffeiphila]MBM7343813.1 O-antigen/teichoic acid export membrane protein [Pantoea coffeiphila]